MKKNSDWGIVFLVRLSRDSVNSVPTTETKLRAGLLLQTRNFSILNFSGVWGPFLIIAPASTLHNWQQEVQRFVPNLKVVPYWGNVQERKILRQFWELKDLHTADASFHIVITSYQIIITDFKYFNRMKWQYLILDEAQVH